MDRDMIKTEIVDISELTIHPIALLNPTITGLQFDAFRADILAKGQLVPVDATYDYKVFNGRTRLAALKDLGITKVKVKRQPKNITKAEMMEMADSLENRRHATPTQLAIKAWKLWMDGTYATMSAAAKAVGVSLKQVQRINIIGGANEPLPAKQYQRFNRMDILEELFLGRKVLMEGYKPTDSPQTIINILNKLNKIVGTSEIIEMPTKELSLEETIWVAKITEAYNKQSELVKTALFEKLKEANSRTVI